MTGTVTLAHDVHGPDAAGTPTAVLLGSLGASRGMWDAQVEALSGSARIVAADLRGHGQSPAPTGEYAMEDLAADVLALMDSLGIDRAHLVGLSLGGAVAQTIALDHPERLETLTLISTAPKFGETQTWLDKAEKVREQGTGVLADTVVGNWFTDECFASNPALPRRFADGIRTTSDDGYAGCCHAIAGFDARARLADITVPTWVIAGEEDTSTPLPVVASLHDGIPGSRFTKISPAKHLVNVERPADVNRVLAEQWGLTA
ncbi:3-oxoadipate enol-lactonase [Corynebacterium hansenii]|uniref:3-oxoadipate enol-lactonase n=1 Tax=Corynebacterium hansenii TaxID=394964 RepID=A0ABV7ZN88_9CORY|nr:3-oxoadipate enol-lactonase [Corynebacterium hansenii]WJZ00617.1 3-oxoadipate enol-lactonase 2 [Corynebacterium hansenii]